MSKKVIAILSQHPTLQKLDEALTETRNFYEKRLKELASEADEAHKKHWEEIEAELVRLGLSTAEELKVHNLVISNSQDAIFKIEKEEKNGIPKELSDLLSTLKKAAGDRGVKVETEVIKLNKDDDACEDCGHQH